MEKGKIIFLNGTSSSGKTTIAKELQQISEEAYLLVSVDNFINMLPQKYLKGECNETFNKEILKIIHGMHHSISALASTGNNIIVDHVLEDKEWLKECVNVLANFQVLFVGVHCPLEELEKRERNRGDRKIGLARFQYNLVHSHGVYDIKVDTDKYTPLECAQQIRETITDNSSCKAFKILEDKFAKV
ncbi:MAG: chloramphenicol phosphotransferase CPT family protein [Candidatus Cloacimonetes bacterium]|nr:chloramphenicol phosphotransferase CPT family protein [Candidatus Cloacimonadota bacterium]